MAKEPTKRVPPTEVPAEAVERVVRPRDLTTDPGDIVVLRKAAGQPGGAEAWVFELTTRGSHLNSRVFSGYNAAVIEGEQLASHDRVRLVYIEDGQSILLMDYRSVR